MDPTSSTETFAVRASRGQWQAQVTTGMGRRSIGIRQIETGHHIYASYFSRSINHWQSQDCIACHKPQVGN